MQINILDAKNKLSQLIKSAQAGEDVVIANRGEPVVRLVPTTPKSDAKRGSGRAFAAWLRDHPSPRLVQRTHQDIEAEIAEERAAWD